MWAAQNLWELACLRWHHRGLPATPRRLHRGQARSHNNPCKHQILRATQFLWELACLRWHHRGLPAIPRCLHRGQARSHNNPCKHQILRATQFLWELACLRWQQRGLPAIPRCLYRGQARSHNNPCKHQICVRHNSCVSWLACDGITAVCLPHRAACIASKPAPTIIPASIKFACDTILVGAGLPAMAATRFACHTALPVSRASPLPQ